MTAQELHIDLDIELQKINTNATRNVEPEEKDWLLNRETMKFLAKRTRDASDVIKRKGFLEDTKRLIDVEPLIKTEYIKVEQIDAEKGRFLLPSFAYKPVSARFEFSKDCDAVTIKEESTTLNVRYFTVDADVPTTFNIVLQVEGINYTVFKTSDLPLNYTGRGQAYIIKAIKIALQDLADRIPQVAGIDVYYEWFGEEYKENTFFFVGGSTFTGAGINAFSAEKDATFSIKNDVYSFTRKVGDKKIKRPGRLKSQETIDFDLASGISGTIPESPLWTSDKAYGTVYVPKNIIISGVYYTYICNPHLIDIDLGTSLNLDRSICAEIVSLTALHIKALFDSGNYEKYFNETNLIE